MFAQSAAVRVFLAPGVTDMRKSFNGLFALVRRDFREDPLTGHLFVFSNRRRDRLKILYWDGSGLWGCAKRLEGGTFRWPHANDKPIELPRCEVSVLLGGSDSRSGGH